MGDGIISEYDGGHIITITNQTNESNITLATYQLTYNSYFCGTNCSANGTANLTNAGKIFDQFYILDSDYLQTTIPTFQAYYGTNSSNLSEYNYQEVDPGFYYWKIEGTKGRKQFVDWVPSAFSFNLTEWAIWGEEAREYQTSQTGGFNIFAEIAWGQTFTVGTLTTDEAYTIDKIRVYLENGGSPTGSITLSLQYTTGGGAPNNTRIREMTRAVGDLSYGWEEFDIPDFIVTPSTKYAIVINGTGSGTINWRIANTNPYSGGSLWQDAPGWTEFSANDFTFSVISSDGSITLNSPINNNVSTTINNSFNCSADMNTFYEVANLSLWTNSTGTWHRNATYDASGDSTNNVTHVFDVNLTEGGYYLWTCEAWSNDSTQGWATENRTITVNDIILPHTVINSITTTQGSQSITGNVTATDTNLDSCWYSIFNSTGMIDPSTTENTSVTCDGTFAETVSAYGTYNLTYYANDSAGNENQTTSSFTTSQLVVVAGGGGGGAAISDSESIDITTLNLLKNADVALAKDSVKERSRDFYITNKDLTEQSVIISCDTTETNTSSQDIDICDYVNFTQTEFLVSPNEEIRSRGTFTILTPPNSKFGDVYYFNIIGISESGKSKLSVSARVTQLATIYKWSYVPFQDENKVDKIKYPVFGISALLSFLVFLGVFLTMRKLKFGASGFFIGLISLVVSFFALLFVL